MQTLSKTSQADPSMPTPIIFTQSAAQKVWELIQEEGNPDLKLRVFITGGGCSGFQYGFSFDEQINEDDVVIYGTTASKEDSAQNPEENAEENDGSGGGNQVMLLVDSMSLQYLLGATIDYEEDISGGQFRISNPNAKTTCGCGSSFSAG